MLRFTVLFLVALLPSALCELPSANGFTKPYMGWSTWSLEATTRPGYGSNWLNADNVMKQAKILAKDLLDYGYDRINIDSFWAAGDTDEYGRFVPDNGRFPDFTNFVAQLKALGLQTGVYLIPGVNCNDIDSKKPVYGMSGVTIDMIASHEDANAFLGSRCRLNFNHPGAQAWVDSQVNLVSSWGVTFIKLDAILPGSSSSIYEWNTKADVIAYHRAISKLPDQAMWLTISWGVDQEADSMAVWRGNADAFRVCQDIEEYGINMTYYGAVRRNVDAYWKLMSKSSYDDVQGWPDMDSLLVATNISISGLTDEERRTKFTMWVMSQSPLYIGDDLTQMDKLGWSFLTNTNVLGLRGALPSARYFNADNGDPTVWSARQFWYAPVIGKTDQYVIAFVNLGGDDPNAESDHELTFYYQYLGLTGKWTITNVWTGNQVASQNNSYTSLVKKHDSQIYLFTKASSETEPLEMKFKL